MRVSQIVLALGLVGVASVLGGCASETETPDVPAPETKSDAKENEVKVDVKDDEVDPNMIYIDKYSTCADIPGTNLFVCCMNYGKCFTGRY